MLPLLSLRHWRTPVAVTLLSYHAVSRGGRQRGAERRTQPRRIAGVHVWCLTSYHGPAFPLSPAPARYLLATVSGESTAS